MEKPSNIIQPLASVTKKAGVASQKVGQFFDKPRQTVFQRFPLLFTLLGAFGLVATLYGFERVIDTVPLFANNPFILLGAGIFTLLFTGTLYKALQHK